MTNKAPLISVIVPVYNVENYIDDCIESICGQTYINLEIILVDDGSVDSSGSRCDSWAARDRRIRVFHKENGGLSDARNYALAHATGSYLCFVDSDDYIASNLIEHLLSLILSSHAQISICDPVHLFGDKKALFSESDRVMKFSSVEAICEMLYQTSFLVSAWGKLFDKSCFNSVKFPYGRYYEDSACMYRVFESAELIIYSNAGLYAYRHREGSITSRHFERKDLDFWHICCEISQYYAQSETALQNAATAYCVSGALRVFLNADSEEFSLELDNCRKYICQNGWSVIFNKRVRNKTRFALFLFYFARSFLKPIYQHVSRW